MQSRRVLILFGGSSNRPDGLRIFLEQLGLDVTLIDNRPDGGGDPLPADRDTCVLDEPPTAAGYARLGACGPSTDEAAGDGVLTAAFGAVTTPPQLPPRTASESAAERVALL